MKKKTNIRTMIRQIVREEVAMAIQEVITELKKPTQQVSQPKSKKRIVEKKQYSKNPVLNEVLNETANDNSDYKTMGGGVYDSSRMNEVVGSEYNNVQPNISEITTGHSGAKPTEELQNVLNRDYTDLMRTISSKRDGK